MKRNRYSFWITRNPSATPRRPLTPPRSGVLHPPGSRRVTRDPERPGGPGSGSCL